MKQNPAAGFIINNIMHPVNHSLDDLCFSMVFPVDDLYVTYSPLMASKILGSLRTSPAVRATARTASNVLSEEEMEKK